MAEEKKGFLLYADVVHTIRKMKKEDAGELFLHILEYVNDNNPETENLIVELTFEPIKQQLKRDLNKYEVKRQKFSEAGKASAEARKRAKENQQNPTTLNDVEKCSTFSTVNDSVNVNVSDTVSDIKIKLHCDDEKSSHENTIVIPETNIPGKDKKTEKEKKVAPKKESEFWKELVDVWFLFYESKFQTKPTFTPIHAKSLKAITSNIKKMVVDSGEDWTAERSQRALKRFLENAFKDTWIQQNFLLTNLNSKFDSIINKTTPNGTQQNTNDPGKKPYKFSVERIEAAANGHS